MDWLLKQNNMQVDNVCAAVDILLTLLIRNTTNPRAVPTPDINEALNLIHQWISG